MAPQPGHNLTRRPSWPSWSPRGRRSVPCRTRAVLVDVSVSRNGPVHGLAEEDFELRVGGTAVPFRMLEPASLPLAALFAMDVSASTAGDRRRRLAAGARRFTDAMTERDVCGVVAFSSEARFVRSFEPCDLGVGDDVLARSPGGATAIWDGVILSLAALRGRRERALLLLFTDGEDNLSWVGGTTSGVPSVVGGTDLRDRDVASANAPRHANGGTRHQAAREVAEGSGGRVVTIQSGRDRGCLR